MEARLRRKAQKFLSDTCNIQRATYPAPGAYMDVSPSGWTTIYTNEPCQLYRAGSSKDNLTLVGQQTVAEYDYRLALGYDIEVQVGDRIVVGGKTYNVVGVQDELSQKFWSIAYLQRIADHE